MKVAAAAARPHSAGYTRKSEWGEGGIVERWERWKINAWGRRGRDRWGAAEDTGPGKSFCGLQSRVVEVRSFLHGRCGRKGHTVRAGKLIVQHIILFSMVSLSSPGERRYIWGPRTS